MRRLLAALGFFALSIFGMLGCAGRDEPVTLLTDPARDAPVYEGVNTILTTTPVSPGGSVELTVRGGELWFEVSRWNGANWVFMYTYDGKSKALLYDPPRELQESGDALAVEVLTVPIPEFVPASVIKICEHGVRDGCVTVEVEVS